MINLDSYFELLESKAIHFLTGVPDSLLNDFCKYAEKKLNSYQHIIAANEGNAIAIATGNYLTTGKVPLVYMQNSGIGNAMNPLLSLTHDDVYAIPMILLIGWRGAPNTGDWAQHKRQGELTPVLMDDMNIPYKVADSDNIFELTNWALETALATSGPVAIIAQKGVLAQAEKENKRINADTYPLSREDAMRVVINHLDKETVYIGSTGRAARELYDILKDAGRESSCILNVGAMGHASSIAQGMVLGNKEQNVVAFDGDSSSIMHLGSYTNLSKIDCPNFLHIVLNNGVHESVGGQTSAGFHVDLTGIARSCGLATLDSFVKSEEELIAALDQLKNATKASFIEVRINQGLRPGIPPLRYDPKVLKEEFMSKYQ